MIYPNDPAFPYTDVQDSNGMTIRAQIAAMAMQGILANSGAWSDWGLSQVIENSIKHADALIAELNRTER